jgi:hypothetical protein
MTPELAWTIEQAYAVFQRYPSHLAPRTASWHEDPAAKEIERRVQHTPLACQSRDDLEVCLMGAFDGASLKHFLPRLFELFADDSSPMVSYLAFKLAWDRACDWPPEERDLVTRFYGARFLGQLRDGRARALADTFVDVAQAIHDLRPLFFLWEWEATRTASIMLARFVLEESAELQHRLRSSDWAPPLPLDPLAEALRHWLGSPAVNRRLDEAYRSAPHAPGSTLLAAAVDYLPAG